MQTLKIGWIGTGVMGSAMCRHLLDAGHSLSIYTRTKTRAQTLLDSGAAWCASPGEVAAASEIIFTIVGFPADVREVMLADNGVIPHADKGSVIIDMTTSTPALAKIIYREAGAAGCSAIDAPVSGGDTGARNSTLAIMAGGDRTAFDTVYPLFRLLGENIRYMGPAGAGQHTKMSNQVLIAGTMIGVVESLLYARKAGLDPQQVMSIVGKGAAASWSYNNLGPRIIQRDFSPGFYIKHFIKDMGIALAEAKRMQLALPGLALVEQFYRAAAARGLEDDGTQGLYKVLEQLNGMEELR